MDETVVDPTVPVGVDTDTDADARRILAPKPDAGVDDASLSPHAGGPDADVVDAPDLTALESDPLDLGTLAADVPLDGTDLLGTGAILAAVAYVGTGLVKQVLFRLDWLESPRAVVFLRYLPIVIGALAAVFWWTAPLVDVTVGGRAIPLPTIIIGALAGRSSEAGYLLVRQRLPWLDWFTLTSEGPNRTAALLKNTGRQP